MVFDLCDSFYDTTLIVYAESCVFEFACNDDFCDFQSKMSDLNLTGGVTYYIVVGGGGIATLLSLWEDVPLRHTATSGGLFGTEWLRRWARTPRSDGSAGVPFDTTRVEEFEIRVLPGNFHWMKRPHYAYIETQSERWIGSIAAANEANMKGDTLIQVIMVPGDHFSAFPEVVRRYMALIEEDSRR